MDVIQPTLGLISQLYWEEEERIQRIRGRGEKESPTTS
jgi:hypothetical protein